MSIIVNARLENSGIWIGIPILAIIVVNGFLFWMFYEIEILKADATQKADATLKTDTTKTSEENKPNEEEDIPIKVRKDVRVIIWNYFDSDMFKATTGSLLFPIFLFLFERKFKVLEKREQERKDDQWEAIELMRKTWSILYETCTDITHFKKNTDKITIEEKIRTLAQILSRIIRVENLCYFRFPEVGQVKNFIYILKLELRLGYSVAQYIKRDLDDNVNGRTEETKQLQKYLSLTSRSIHVFSLDKCVKILTFNMNLEDSVNSKKDIEKMKLELQNIEMEFSKFAEFLQKFEKDNYKPWDPLYGADVDNFRTKLGEFKEEIKNKDYSEIDKFNIEESDVFTLLKKLEPDRRLKSYSLIYSNEFHKKLFEEVSNRLELEQIVSEVRALKITSMLTNVFKSLRKTILDGIKPEPDSSIDISEEKKSVNEKDKK